MAVMTLLDLVQSILSSLGSDQVNNVSDTVESLQVAECVRQTYYNMLGRYDLPEHNILIQLVASGNNQQPTLMTLPAGMSRIEWIKYFDTNPEDGGALADDFEHDLNVDLVNSGPGWFTTSNTSNAIALGTVTFTVATGQSISAGQTAFCYTGSPPTAAASMNGTVTSYNSGTGALVLSISATNGTGTYAIWTISQFANAVFGPGYCDVALLPIDDFFRYINQYNPAESDVGSYQLAVTDNATGNPSNFTIYYKNSSQPRFATVLSNEWVIFDSFDATQDVTLQSSKTEVMAWSIPFFTMSNTFVPNLDEQHFPILLNDAKSLAYYELKQMPHQKAEEEVARQLVSLQKWKAISGKPTYFQELPDFGRRGSSPAWPFKHWGQF